MCCFTRPSHQCGFTYSGASIYTYHPHLRDFVTLVGLYSVARSKPWAWSGFGFSLFQKVPFGLHARSTGITRGFIWTFFVCVCHVRTGIITFPPQPTLVLHHRPGDDISGIMSIFCAHFKPPPPGKNDQRLTCHSLVQR